MTKIYADTQGGAGGMPGMPGGAGGMPGFPGGFPGQGADAGQQKGPQVDEVD